jgi:hypothetical protein
VDRRWWRIGALTLLLPGLVSFTPAPPTGRAGAAGVGGGGYTHLGATTVGAWAGVSGELTVTDPAVRAGSFDFVAARFMAKQEIPGGTRWLEAGWAEVGWSGAGRQRVYTFDTASQRWTFYDQFPLRPGDRIAITLTADPGGIWQATVRWHGTWYPLTSTRLPAGGRATIEEYVEVYRDPARPGAPLAVPQVALSDVAVYAPGSAAHPWTDAGVPSYRGGTPNGYCLTRRDAWTSWQAGTCSPP